MARCFTWGMYYSGKEERFLKNVLKNINASRTKTYRLLSLLYKTEITEETFNALSTLTFPDGKGFSNLSKEILNHANELKVYIDNLAVDFARIFLAAGINQGNAAFPYESVYTSSKKIVMQDAWEETKKLYSKYGFVLKNASSDMLEDHISMELEFMAHLCEVRDVDYKLSSTFIKEHLLNWCETFCNDIKKFATEDFYKYLAEATLEFIKNDLDFVCAANEYIGNSTEENQGNSYCVSTTDFDIILKDLKKTYQIFAPVCFPKRGVNGTDLIRYGQINSINEIVFDRPSDFSAKEVYYPVMQTLFKFTQDTCTQSELTDDRDLLIFARPCDINAISRLDRIFMENGGNSDLYYERMRKKVKFVLMECMGGYDQCFCVSMGANETSNYEFAVRPNEDHVFIHLNTSLFNSYFSNENTSDYTPEFVQSNVRTVKIPVIDGTNGVREATNLEFWNEYDEKCIGCGGCNTVCPTCSCFDTVDIRYNEGSLDGERRRVWSSCMLNSFTRTAGGGQARKTAGANMRFKVLHKIHDFSSRFNTQEYMCVGCGRCNKRCPQNITYSDIVNRFYDEMNNKGGRQDVQ